MTRASAAALVAVALAAGLALRLTRLDVRPMHHDEANQAVKFGALVERSQYRYDPHDHHGPTLYYLTLPAAWLRGQATLATLDERTLRAVPAVFGAATILLLPVLTSGIGRTAVASAAFLMALSPAMVFYSRMYIQESMFACFALAFTIAVGRAMTEPGLRWPVAAGVAAGLAIATKETSAIVLPASVVAAAVAWWSLGANRPGPRLAERWWWTEAVVSAATAAVIAALFYSSFLANPGSALGPLLAAGTYLERAVDPASHVQPWHYYLGLLAWSSSGGLTWSEGVVLVLAAVGALTAVPLGSARAAAAESSFWPRYLACCAAISTAVFSLIPVQDAVEPAAVLRPDHRRGRDWSVRDRASLGPAHDAVRAGRRPGSRMR